MSHLRLEIDHGDESEINTAVFLGRSALMRPSTSSIALGSLVLLWLASPAAVALSSGETRPVAIANLIPADGMARDLLGASADAVGDVIVGGAPFARGEFPNMGAVYAFRRVDGMLRDDQKIGPDLTRGTGFGKDVCLDRGSFGTRLVIGVSWQGCSGSEADCGEAYVFQDSAGTWIETARLVSDNHVAEQGFGESVAIEGNRIAVGAPDDTPGAVHIFEFDGSTWQRTQIVRPGEPTGLFGADVALEGDLLVVGAPGDFEFASGSGAVFVFRRNAASGLWEKVQRFKASDPGFQDVFGSALAISGTTIVVGANNPIEEPGVAYFFEHDPSADRWFETVRLEPLDGHPNNAFGVDLDLEGDLAIVGAPNDEHGDDVAGAVYVYRRGDGTWPQVEKLIAPSGSNGHQFGSSVALAEDSIVIGAVSDNTIGSQAGSLFVYLKGEVLAGNVNTGDGSCPADVLFVNGSPGNSKNLVTVNSGVPSTISVERAPSGNGAYAFWLYDFRKYAGASIQYQKGATSYDLGSGVKAIPINNSVTPGSVPCPLTFPVGWTSRSLGAGVAGTFCLNSQPGFPRAPTSFNVIFPPGNFILGGLVTDQNSINSPALNVSIANWIFVRSR